MNRGVQTQGFALLEVFDWKTKILISETRQKNLLLDTGLIAQANGVGFGNLFATCILGGGSTQPNQFTTANTFTQSGNVVTCSGAFFTSAMVGGVLKWNTSSTAGAEQYITGFTDSTHVTVSNSATVSTPGTATIFQVQQAGLQSVLASLGSFLESNTYQSYSSSTSITGNVLTLARSIVFPTQSLNYTINEIGYKSSPTGTGSCLGRFDISGSPVTVSTSQFIVVTLTITFTLSPSAPASVSNVGTNVNTAGSAMLTCWDCQSVNTSGSTQNLQSGSSSDLMDRSQSISVLLGSSAPTLPGSIPTPALTNGQCNTAVPQTGLYVLGNGSIAALGGQQIVSTKAVKTGSANFSFSLSTAGETCYGLTFGKGVSGNQVTNIFYLNFTNPITLPSGTLSGNLTFTNIYGRQLSC